MLLTIAALGVAGTYLARQSQTSDDRRPVRVRNWETVLTSGRLIGDKAARVKLVEFSDYQCPYCRRFQPALKALEARYGSKLAVVYVHFPLESHAHAFAAARAAECASKQGRFEQYSDLLFEKQDSLGRKTWNGFAADAGVADLSVFDACIADSTSTPLVGKGRLAATSLEVRSTPTILVNGWRFRGADSLGVTQAVDALVAGRDPYRTHWWSPGSD